MAKPFKIPVVINGFDIVLEILKRTEKWEFKDDVSDEYKKGFTDLRKALISTLEKMKEETHLIDSKKENDVKNGNCIR